eukprot:gene10261-8180_t
MNASMRVESASRAGHASLRVRRARDARCAALKTTPATLNLKVRNRLGASDLLVTDVCLGTMDTAEIYPVPPNPATTGATSNILGAWLCNKPRDQFVVATKVTGRAYHLGFVPAGRTDPRAADTPARLDASSIKAGVEGELRRLRTDYLDVIQLHWPDRYVPAFGKAQYKQYVPTFGKAQYKQSDADAHVEKAEASGFPVTSFHDQVVAMGELIKSGKIRAWGLSNETSWGVMQFCLAADALGVPRPVTIQWSLSLSQQQKKILCGGLSGKYLEENADPEELARSRLTLHPQRYARFNSDRMHRAVRQYAAIAKEAGMSPSQLAYAFCRSRSFIPSTIIGGTTIKQLRENLEVFGGPMELSESVLAAIEEVHVENRNPALTD